MTKNRRAKQDARKHAAEAEVSYTQALREVGLNAVIPGIPTALPTLTRLTGGWRRGQLITVGSPAGGGKSSFALNSAATALKAGKLVLFISMEMTSNELAAKMSTLVSDRSDVPFGAELFLESRSSMTIADIRRLADRVAADVRARTFLAGRSFEGLDLIVIDHLQLIDSSGLAGSRSEKLSQISRALKRLATELDVPVMALTQLAASADGSGVSSLRGTGSLSQDSDLVILLDRDGDGGSFRAHLAKNRTGVVGEIIGCRLDGYALKEINLPRIPEPESRPNPILREYAEALLSGEISLTQFLEGFTVDGEGATGAERQTAKRQLLAFEDSFGGAIWAGLELTGPVRKTIESWTGRTGPAVDLELTVWELGEHGGYYFVEGTTDLERAKASLRAWFLDLVPEDIAEYDELFERDGFTLTARSDWFWNPLDPQDPTGESELLTAERDGIRWGARLMEGVFATC